jgi:hypothetical protein
VFKFWWNEKFYLFDTEVIVVVIIIIDRTALYINPTKCQRSTRIVNNKLDLTSNLDAKTSNTPRRPFEKEKLINE